MSGPVEFQFRVWVHPADPPDLAVWWYGLEPTKSNAGFVEDWICEALENVDLHERFELDPEKDWQVIGKGTLNGYYDYWGEYEDIRNIDEFEKAEVPASFFDSPTILTTDAEL